MNQQFQVQVQRLDNGFLIAASHDAGKRWKQQAPDEESTRKQLHDIVEHMFDKVEKAKPDAQPIPTPAS